MAHRYVKINNFHSEFLNCAATVVESVPSSANQTLDGPQIPDKSLIRLSIIDSLDDLRARKIEWKKLLEMSPTNTIFQTFEWISSCWKVFNSNSKLFLILIEKADRIVGIAPLAIRRKKFLGIKQRVVEFIGSGLSDYLDFIYSSEVPDILLMMLDCLSKNRHRWDIAQLTNIPNDSITLSILPTFLDSNGYLSDIRIMCEAFSYIFGNPELDKNVVKKKSLKRHHNYFVRNGNLEFINLKVQKDILCHIDGFFEQHIKRRSVTEHKSQFIDTRHREFFRELVGAFARTDFLLFSVLLFNKVPLAFHFGFEYEKKIIWYKPAFNIDFYKKSPGQVMLKYLFEYGMDRKVSEFDFTIGSEPFKLRFSNRARSLYTVNVFQKRMTYVYNRALRNLKDILKRSIIFTYMRRK